MEPKAAAAAAAATEVEELIPSLSNDVAVNILARVPRADHPTLSLVSKAIKSLVSSPLFFTTRTLVSSTQHHIYLSLRSLRSPFSLFSFTLNYHNHNHNHPYSLLRVPPFPSPSIGSAYVSLGPTIFVLGGCIHDVPTHHVWTLDCRFNKWEPAPPMRVAREFPAAGVIDNKIYVVGGCVSDTWARSTHWAEVFDPVIGKWEAVPSPVEIHAKWMHASAVVDDKLYAMSDRGGIVYDPKNMAWESVEGELDMGWRGRACVVDGILYCYNFLGQIRGFDVKENVWKEVKGLDKCLPRFLCGATMVHVGQKLVVVWEERVSWSLNRNRNRNRNRKDVEIWCAEIGVDKRDNGELWGKIGLVDKVRTMPYGSAIVHCLAVSV